ARGASTHPCIGSRSWSGRRGLGQCARRGGSGSRIGKRRANHRAADAARARGRQRPLRGAPGGGIAQTAEELLPFARRGAWRAPGASPGPSQRERGFRERFWSAAAFPCHSLERALALLAVSLRAVIHHRRLRWIAFWKVVFVPVILDVPIGLRRRSRVGGRLRRAQRLPVPAPPLSRRFGHRAPPLS